MGGLIGGPVARYLVKHSSSPDGTPDDQVAPTAFEKPDVGRVITSLVLIESIALIAICQVDNLFGRNEKVTDIKHALS